MPSSFNKYRLKGAYHKGWYLTESWYKKLIDRAVDFCDGSTLDIGCGEGLLISRIEHNGYKVLGLDYDVDAINLAKEIFLDADKKLLLMDADTIVFREDATWEYLACINTIEHLNNPENLLKIIDNNITKGAIISTIDYQGGSLGEDHKREYTMDELMEFFKKYDPTPFRIEDIWIGVEIRK